MARKPRLPAPRGAKPAPSKRRRPAARPATPAKRRSAVRAVPMVNDKVALARVFWVVDIKKILGSARCAGLTVEHQQQTMWCWAATANSVSHFYDPSSTWTQCTIVNAELGQTNCCTNGSTAACNKAWYLDKALTRVGCLQSMASGTLSFATLKSLINAGRPPCARQGWSGGGGHFMAVTSYYEGLLGLIAGAGSTARRLRISDPWYGDSVIDYDTFVSGYQGSGSWTHSYRTEP